MKPKNSGREKSKRLAKGSKVVNEKASQALSVAAVTDPASVAVAVANAELAHKQREVIVVTAELAKKQNELTLTEQFSATQINANLFTAELAKQQSALLAEQLAASEMRAKLNASLLDDLRVQESDSKLQKQGKQKDKQEKAVEQATKLAILETTVKYEQLRTENLLKETQIKLEYERALKAATDAEKEQLIQISRQYISYMRAQNIFEMMSRNMQSSSATGAAPSINPQMQLAIMLGLGGPTTALPDFSLLTQYTTAAVPFQLTHEDNPKQKKSKKNKKNKKYKKYKKKRKDSSSDSSSSESSESSDISSDDDRSKKRRRKEK